LLALDYRASLLENWGNDMLALVLAALTTVADPALPAMFQAQAEVAADASKPRRVCRNVPVPHTRTLRRQCTTVEPQAARAPKAPPPPPVLTTFAVGMMVVDTQGGAVGTITAVAADTVTVKTAKHEAALPKTSLTISEGKALFGLTQAQLDASVEQALAARPELKVGAPVKGAAGESVGTIEAVGDGSVTIALTAGQRVSIPRSGIALEADGSGRIGLTAAELQAKLEAAQPSS
jgi:preprotein translocase subunit YajC